MRQFGTRRAIPANQDVVGADAWTVAERHLHLPLECAANYFRSDVETIGRGEQRNDIVFTRRIVD